MPAQTKTTDSEHARLQNDYGADYWVRTSAQQHRVRIFTTIFTSITPYA
jgi:hypothetical protein